MVGHARFVDSLKTRDDEVARCDTMMTLSKTGIDVEGHDVKVAMTWMMIPMT